MAFFQAPPALGNQFDDDPLLSDYLEREFADADFKRLRDELRPLGELAGGDLYRQQLAELRVEPTLTQWDAWGNRIDRIDVTPLWKRAQVLAARHGMVAAAYEPTYGAKSRLHQFAVVHLLGPSLDVYMCPLAMTDGAARTLLAAGNQTLIDRAVPRLTTRDPDRMWTSGQWMTERTGGSDVSTTETVARGGDGDWRLWGTKWFTSATTAEMALTLARPEGNPDGSRGLALFFVETRDEHGRLRGIEVNRLKDKLGTRKVPTAELTLDGTPAIAVAGLSEGVRAITPMLSVTRTWNSVAGVGLMRRALALARDFARRRSAFGALLIDKPLHVDTLAGLEAEYAGAFLLAFRVAGLLGRAENGRGDDAEDRLLRALTPIAKLTTAKQAVHIASEAIECCGGAGYVEDTGLPRVLADCQVLPIWEGTTNVLSLDTLRALAKGAFPGVAAEIEQHLQQATGDSLAPAVAAARSGLARAQAWLAASTSDAVRLESGARRFALTLGRTLELAYLVAHAQWCLDHDREQRGARLVAAARRFAAAGVDLIRDVAYDDSRLLA